jgi:hypothetical protein
MRPRHVSRLISSPAQSLGSGRPLSGRKALSLEKQKPKNFCYCAFINWRFCPVAAISVANTPEPWNK